MGFGNFDIHAMQAQMRNQEVREEERTPPTREELKREQEQERVSEESDANYKDTTDLDPRMGGEGGDTGSDNTVELPPERPKKKVAGKQVVKKSAGRKSRIHSEYMQVRDFPRELIAYVRNEFPMATNNTDALAAYIYVKSGCSVSVPDSVKELAKQWDGNKSVESLSMKLEAAEKKLSDMAVLLDEMELLISFHLFDRLGFRKESPKDAQSVNLLEQDGAYALMQRAKEQMRALQKQIRIREGRPIR